MPRPKSNGPYTPLAANYYRDDAILKVGERAEVLFVRCLAFLGDSSSDGFITEMQMLKVVGLGLTKVQSRVDLLLTEGLLVAIPGGFQVRSWLKWNKTAEEIGREHKRDRERHASKSEASSPISERNPDGMATESVRHYTSLHDTAHHITSIVAEARDDVSELCKLLQSLIVANGSKEPTIGKTWLNEARLMLDVDGRDPTHAARLIRWCQSDPFWRGNILSMSTFRRKYDQLRLAANKQIADRKPTRTESNMETVAQYAQLEQIGIEA